MKENKKQMEDKLVRTDNCTFRRYEDDEYKPAQAGIVPRTSCKRDRVAYVDKEFRKNCPLAGLTQL